MLIHECTLKEQTTPANLDIANEANIQPLAKTIAYKPTNSSTHERQALRGPAESAGGPLVVGQTVSGRRAIQLDFGVVVDLG